MVIKERKLIERLAREGGLPEPEVTWTRFSGGSAMDDALISGSLDLAAAGVAPVVHPVVRVHPANGRKALFVNEGFITHIVGLVEDESAALLAELFRHSTDDRFIHRHRWQPFDLVMWDNRSILHLATGRPPHLRRTLYRTTMRGDEPVAIAAAG